MRGAFEDQGGLFSYISPEARVSGEPSAEEDLADANARRPQDPSGSGCPDHSRY